ncbi:MAG: ferrochelatase [Dissulfurispiraceae bacterium]
MIGVLLLNLGGPDSPDAVKPFLYNLFSDREIIKLGPPLLQKPIASFIASTRSGKTRAMYSMIGGKSPILEITKAQAAALEEVLNSGHNALNDAHYRVYIGMRYWHPFIEDTLERMHRDGIKDIIALSLYPHYSIATTGSSVGRLKSAMKSYPGLSLRCITSWYDHQLYIEALIERIKSGLTLFCEEPGVLFSAHSLPQKFIDAGDPYLNEIEGTISAITKKIEIHWYLSFQSKSGPVKWLEPSTEQMLKDLARKGVKDLLVVPISFVSDHIETLYEIDILYRNMAAGFGINLKRTESLNTEQTFIKALADMVTKA